jgi:hypothetical protein
MSFFPLSLALSPGGEGTRDGNFRDDMSSRPAGERARERGEKI